METAKAKVAAKETVLDQVKAVKPTDPVALAEAKVALAEAKVEREEAKVEREEAKVALAKAEGDAEETAAAKQVLVAARKGLATFIDLLAGALDMSFCHLTHLTCCFVT